MTTPSTVSAGWKQAQDLFFQKTGKHLVASEKEDVDDVMSKLERRFAGTGEKDLGAPELKDKAKELTLAVLTGLKVLADFAAPVVSSMYPPAGYCLQAASFLLDMPGRVSEVFGGFTELFEAIQGFMVHFKILGRAEKNTGIPVELAENANKMMVSFVSLCALCYLPIRAGKLAKVKLVLGAALFKYDAGIHVELEKFAKLAKAENNITNAVTLEHVLRTEKGIELSNRRLLVISTDVQATKERVSAIGGGVQSLVTDSTVRKRDLMMNAAHEEVASRLDENIAKLCDLQAQTLQRMKKSRIPNSGSWLDEEGAANTRYLAWSDFSNDVAPVLAITGLPNSGKSYLASSIISRLQEKQSSGSRLVVAYYSFSKVDPRGSADRTPSEDPVIQALKCMAYQIVRRSIPYMQELRDASKSKESLVSKNSTYKQCWEALRLSSARIDLSCVLVFDGLDQLSNDTMRRELLDLLALQRSDASNQQIRCRSLLTDLPQSFAGQPVPTIVISKYNASDIEEYIAHELKSDGKVADFQSDNAEMFATFKRGNITEETDFGVIHSRILRIKSAIEDYESATSIEEIMHEPLEGEREKIAQEIIDDLNRNLKSEDIRELNEILVWTLYGSFYLNVEIMGQILTARGFANGSKYLGQKVLDRSRFARILDVNVDDHVLDCKSSDLTKLLKKMERATSTLSNASDDDEPQITMEIKIRQATRSTVRKFLWELNQKAIFDSSFFSPTEMTVESKTLIHINAVDSHSIILCQSLDFLMDDPKEDVKDLSRWSDVKEVTQWAVTNLPFQLQEALEAEEKFNMPLPNRNEIVLGLLSLATDIQVTAKHWKKALNPEDGWLDNQETVEVIDKWLRGEGCKFKAIDTLPSNGKRRLNKLLKAAGRYGYWYELTKSIGREWLQDHDWDAKRAFSWVDSYISMIERSTAKPTEDFCRENESQTASDTSKRDGNNQKAQGSPLESARTYQTVLKSEVEGNDLSLGKSRNEGSNTAKADLFRESSGSSDGHKMEGEMSSATPVSEEINAPEADEESEKGDFDSRRDRSISLSAKERINRAIGWTKRELKIEILDAVSLRRVAEVFLAEGLFEDAITTYKKALEFPQNVTRTRRGLALAFGRTGDIKEAVDNMVQVLEAYEPQGIASPKDSKELRDDRVSLARWYMLLKDPSNAAIYFEKAIDNDDIDFNLYSELCESLFYSSDREQGTAKFLERINDKVEHLENVLSASTNQGGEQIFLEMSIIPLVRRTNTVDIFSAAIKKALKNLKRNKTTSYDRLFFGYYELLSLVLSDKSPDNIEMAARGFSKICSQLSALEQNMGSDLHYNAHLRSSQLYYNLAITYPERAKHCEHQMELISRNFRHNSYEGSSIPCHNYYCHFLSKIGRQDEARKLLIIHVKDAYDILNDEDRYNDIDAYNFIVEVSLLLDDVPGAMTVLSLMGPFNPPKEEVSETVSKSMSSIEEGAVQLNIEFDSRVDESPQQRHPLNNFKSYNDLTEASRDGLSNSFTAGASLDTEKVEEAKIATRQDMETADAAEPVSEPDDIQRNCLFECDGDCLRKQWRRPGDFFVCMACVQCVFCHGCAEKIKTDTLDRSICDKSHNLVFIPPWSFEHKRKVGLGNVMVGGKMVPGSWERTGGTIVSVKEWLNGLWKEWGIENPAEEKDCDVAVQTAD